MRGILAAASFALVATSAAAAPAGSPGVDCTVVVEADTGAVIARDETCALRHTPASTFKVALAVIGFDEEILETPDAPVWDPPADADRVKEPTDPTKWLAQSVVWYSRHLVAELGADAFARDVAELGYGNADVSGDPGANNGLTRSWIDSSLEISPDEQVAFLRRLLAHDLPVAGEAIDSTIATMPTFAADGLVVRGKTGMAWHRDASGTPQRSDARAWFVGWAELGPRTVVFARYAERPDDGDRPLSVVLRDSMLADLPALVGEPAK